MDSTKSDCVSSLFIVISSDLRGVVLLISEFPGGGTVSCGPHFLSFKVPTTGPEPGTENKGSRKLQHRLKQG